MAVARRLKPSRATAVYLVSNVALLPCRTQFINYNNFLILDQTKARRDEKILGGDRPPPLSKGLDDRAPSLPYLKVWIRH